MGDFIDAIEENQEYNKGIIRFNAKEKSVYEKETYYRIIHPEQISIFVIAFLIIGCFTGVSPVKADFEQRYN